MKANEFIRLAKSEGACGAGIDRLRYWADLRGLDLRKTEISTYFWYCLGRITREDFRYPYADDMRWCFRRLIAWSDRPPTAKKQAYRALGVEPRSPGFGGVDGALYDVGYASFKLCTEALIRAFSD